MKTTITAVALLLLTLGVNAQNKQVQSETKTTVTTVKDSDGEKQYVKQQNVQQTQPIEFQNPDGNSLNKTTVDTPVQVTSTTQITNPDGTTRTVDVDRSSVYTYNGKDYKVNLDASGYTHVVKRYENTGETEKNVYQQLHLPWKRQNVYRIFRHGR